MATPSSSTTAARCGQHAASANKTRKKKCLPPFRTFSIRTRGELPVFWPSVCVQLFPVRPAERKHSSDTGPCCLGWERDTDTPHQRGPPGKMTHSQIPKLNKHDHSWPRLPCQTPCSHTMAEGGVLKAWSHRVFPAAPQGGDQSRPAAEQRAGTREVQSQALCAPHSARASCGRPDCVSLGG